MAFAVVVDSTCDLTEEEYKTWGVTMVPLSVLIDGEVFKDQVDITSEEFYERLAHAEAFPQSSQPTPYDFKCAYEALAQQGYDGVISLHIAGVLSGTIESARTAAAEVDVDVRVIDAAASGTTASMGIVARRACELRDAGASLDEAQAELEALCARAFMLIAPDTLDYLLKGGRLSADQVKTASMLNIKPLFSFNETGTLVAYGKAKGMRGVIKTMTEELKRRTEEQGTQYVRFCHSDNQKAVDDLKESLAKSGVSYIDYGTCLCGAIIATHLGPGALGIAMISENQG